MLDPSETCGTTTIIAYGDETVPSIFKANCHMYMQLPLNFIQNNRIWIFQKTNLQLFIVRNGNKNKHRGKVNKYMLLKSYMVTGIFVITFSLWDAVCFSVINQNTTHFAAVLSLYISANVLKFCKSLCHGKSGWKARQVLCLSSQLN